MPVDRPLAADLAENLVTLYQQAETRLAADLARRLAGGMDSPTWAQDKLRGLTTLRRFSENLVSRLDGALGDEIAQSTILAYVRGGNAALDDLGRAQSTHPEWLRAAGINNPNDRLRAMIERRQAGVAAQLAQARQALPGADAIARLAFSLTTQLRGTHLRIARWQLDSYREVIAAGSAPEVLLGITTRRRASQIAWEGLLSQGITGFVDRAGRGWNLASYVEMASRSTVAQAAVEGHLDRLGAAGLDLVIVSNAPQECEKCRPWEGKILTRGGPGGKRTVQVEHGTRDDELVDVDVAGSVDEAVSAGLMHPNCRHSLSAYLAGVTRIPTNTEDPEGDKARQKLRALERKVRAAKLKAETTIDPAAKAGHEAKVRATQAQIREHVKATGLHRQPAREQIDLGHRPPPGPVASTPLAPSPPPPPASTPAKTAPPTPKPKPAAKKAAPAKAAKKPAKTAPPPPWKAAKAAPAKKAPPTKAAKKTAPRKTTPPPPSKAAAPAPTPQAAPAVARTVTQRTPLTGGLTGEAELVEYSDGSRVVIKTARSFGNTTARAQADAEELAPMVLRAVGAGAPRVTRLNAASVEMEFIDGRLGSELEGRIYTASDRAAGDLAGQRYLDQLGSLSGQRMGLADLLSHNIDRHGGNWILRDGEMVGIDNGAAFQYFNARPAAIRRAPHRAIDPSRREPAHLFGNERGEWVSNPFTHEDVAEVRTRINALRPEFERLGHADWHDYMLMRLAQVEEYASGMVNLIAGH